MRPRRPSEDLPAASPLFGKAHARNRGLPRPCRLRRQGEARGRPRASPASELDDRQSRTGHHAGLIWPTFRRRAAISSDVSRLTASTRLAWAAPDCFRVACTAFVTSAIATLKYLNEGGPPPCWRVTTSMTEKASADAFGHQEV